MNPPSNTPRGSAAPQPPFLACVPPSAPPDLRRLRLAPASGADPADLIRNGQVPHPGLLLRNGAFAWDNAGDTVRLDGDCPKCGARRRAYAFLNEHGFLRTRCRDCGYRGLTLDKAPEPTPQLCRALDAESQPVPPSPLALALPKLRPETFGAFLQLHLCTAAPRARLAERLVHVQGVHRVSAYRRLAALERLGLLAPTADGALHLIHRVPEPLNAEALLELEYGPALRAVAERLAGGTLGRNALRRATGLAHAHLQDALLRFDPACNALIPPASGPEKARRLKVRAHDARDSIEPTTNDIQDECRNYVGDGAPTDPLAQERQRVLGEILDGTRGVIRGEWDVAARALRVLADSSEDKDLVVERLAEEQANQGVAEPWQVVWKVDAQANFGQRPRWGWQDALPWLLRRTDDACSRAVLRLATCACLDRDAGVMELHVPAFGAGPRQDVAYEAFLHRLAGRIGALFNQVERRRWAVTLTPQARDGAQYNRAALDATLSEMGVWRRYLPPLLKPARRPACLRALFRPQVRRRHRRIQSLGAYVGDLIRNERFYPWPTEESE